MRYCHIGVSPVNYPDSDSPGRGEGAMGKLVPSSHKIGELHYHSGRVIPVTGSLGKRLDCANN